MVAFRRCPNCQAVRRPFIHAPGRLACPSCGCVAPTNEWGIVPFRDDGRPAVRKMSTVCSWCKGNGRKRKPCPLCGKVILANGQVAQQAGSLWGKAAPPLRDPKAKRGAHI